MITFKPFFNHQNYKNPKTLLYIILSSLFIFILIIIYLKNSHSNEITKIKKNKNLQEKHFIDEIDTLKIHLKEKLNIIEKQKEIIKKKEIMEREEDRVIVVMVISITYDFDLFLFSLQYIKNVLNINSKNIILILNSSIPNEQEGLITEIIKLTTHYKIKPYFWFGTFTSGDKFERTKLILNDFTKDDNENNFKFILHIDIDEFIDFPMIDDVNKITDKEYESILETRKRFTSFIDYLYRHNYVGVKGRLIDQLAINCQIPENINLLNNWENVNALSNLLDQFPCSTKASEVLAGPIELSKIPIYRSYLRTTDGGHHHLYDEDTLKFYPIKIPVYHFKWRGKIKDKLTERAAVFKEKGIYWYVESENILKNMEQSAVLNVPDCPCKKQTLLQRAKNMFVENNGL
ncbi:hypothetical protein ABK040_004858 [Willaertia magna]